MPHAVQQRTAAIITARTAIFSYALAVVVTVAAVGSPAQTFSVIHNFSGGSDGGGPFVGVTIDRGGNLYGTTQNGGTRGFGVVYRLKRSGSGWLLSTLHSFDGGRDGSVPSARVVFGTDGSLYGITYEGGGSECQGYGCGTVFNLKPPLSACKTAVCPWNETVLYRFSGGTDGANPYSGDLLFDAEGNIYGTTFIGGTSPCYAYGCGTVYELSRAGGGWTKTLLYDFTGGDDGGNPSSGLILDSAGNLYGTTSNYGQYGGGTAFELKHTQSGWSDSTLAQFGPGQSGGYTLEAGLIFDPAGNLYGASSAGGTGNGGTIFELSPSGGNWTLNILYNFTGLGGGPQSSLTMDGSGNLYGTTLLSGQHGYGNVFKLAPSNGGWAYTSLYDFTGGDDGKNPFGGVAFDASGNLYGTTYAGGSSGNGVVFEITP